MFWSRGIREQIYFSWRRVTWKMRNMLVFYVSSNGIFGGHFVSKFQNFRMSIGFVYSCLKWILELKIQQLGRTCAVIHPVQRPEVCQMNQKTLSCFASKEMLILPSSKGTILIGIMTLFHLLPRKLTCPLKSSSWKTILSF